MSFPDPPPSLPPFMLPPFAGGNVGDFGPQIPINNEYPDSHPQFEHAPPFKKPRNSEKNPPNSVPFPPMNPRINPPNLPGSKITSHIFFKTRMCVKFLKDNCWNGENCTFAHGIEDLREPAPNWQELVREKERGQGNWNEDQRIIHRMKICKKFYNGEECPYGEKCNFLHESPSKFKNDMAGLRESSAISIGTMEPIMVHRTWSDQPEITKQVNASSDVFAGNMKPVFWKTKLCSKWVTTGQCAFRERCHFAHGQSELKVPDGHVEAEVTTMSIGSILPANDTSPKIVFGAPTKEGEDKKNLSKWKGTKKINRIYADWIDDLIPPHSLRSTLD